MERGEKRYIRLWNKVYGYIGEGYTKRDHILSQGYYKGHYNRSGTNSTIIKSPPGERRGEAERGESPKGKRNK